MTARVLSAPSRRAPGGLSGLAGRVWGELLHRQRTLTLFAAAMLLAMLPALVALGLDDRLLRGVSVWVKPLKFMSSVALFALSTAWFVGLLPQARRGSRAVRTVVGIIVGFGTVEVAYIALQAALGQASHYSRVDLLHVIAYQIMGAGALALMATQLVLAREIARHSAPEVAPVWRDAVVLGVGAAAPLSAVQPPSGAGLPFLGWHLGGGDLRPAHFIGSHAQQFVPLAGWLIARRWPRHGRALLAIAALALTALWLAAMWRGLQGAVFLPPG
ncbi:MAG: hypothetical protein NTV19_09375 [Burkholderiales bacterium]|nr:hypothetical protein [Burkholderiales bacterium]